MADDYSLPGDTPVVEFAGALCALHPFKTKSGEVRLGFTQVTPKSMNGREVAEWTQPYGGMRFAFQDPVDAERSFQRALTALGTLKAQAPRAEKPLPSG